MDLTISHGFQWEPTQKNWVISRIQELIECEVYVSITSPKKGLKRKASPTQIVAK